jgi:hypothetical protein
MTDPVPKSGEAELLTLEERIVLLAQTYAALPLQVADIKGLVASIIVKLK